MTVEPAFEAPAGLRPTGSLESCPGSVQCGRCFWSRSNGGLCTGCDDAYRARCLKRECWLECDVCSGGRHARTPGCCGRTAVSGEAPPRWLLDLLHAEVPEYAPQPLAVRCRLIPVIYAQLRHLRLPEQFPEIDAWAVPIHKVASRRGRFRSSDLKDYLGLPADRRLILSTCAPDDYQEALWELGDAVRYAEHGIDHWFPGHFSVYSGDSKLYQFVNAKRQLLHAVRSCSSFVWFRHGDTLPLEMYEPVRGAASVLFSSQQTFRRRHLRAVHAEIATADRWCPSGTAFFIVGGSARVPVSEKRVCYRVSSRWQLLALKGRDLANQPAPHLPVAELLQANLRQLLATTVSPVAPP
jgi:hypothetical protein